MKTKKSQKSLKKIISLVVVVVLLAGSYAAVASYNNLWPFAQSEGESDSKPDSNDESNDGPDEEQNGDQSSGGDEATNGASDETDYIRPDITNPPTESSPYPIENERYRIDQNSPTNYSVELYPIINNPSYSDYNAQLRDYKNEVLEYLEFRYGNIDNFTINWIPEDAKNI